MQSRWTILTRPAAAPSARFASAYWPHLGPLRRQWCDGVVPKRALSRLGCRRPVWGYVSGARVLGRGTRKGDQGQDFDPRQPPAVPGLTGLTLIGAADSATVYQAIEHAMRRKVAVKVLHALMHEARERQIFERECALAGQVGEHPHAADIYRSGFAGDRPYIVMRYYARGSLATLLGPAQLLPVGEAVTVCAHVATALQYAHDRGILHRDVKPENILRDAFGDPVLADFGIATERDAATMALRHVMTPAYAPPEVLRDGGGWPYSDVWSLAATLYALLTGHPPFYDRWQGDPRANMRALTGPLPPVTRPGVPGHLLQTLARALIGEPDNRTGSARKLAEELNSDLRLLGLPPVPIRFDMPTGLGGVDQEKTYPARSEPSLLRLRSFAKTEAERVDQEKTHLAGSEPPTVPVRFVAATSSGSLKQEMVRPAGTGKQTTAGHAFISYVREDSQDVDLLQQALEAAGVRVWRDTAELWPGENWRIKIRDAITHDALVFIACFSSRSVARQRSYQNEELHLAIDQMRLQRPDVPWLIPIRFDDCDVPDVPIGAGHSLASIQRADLFGKDSEKNTAKLVGAVLRTLNSHPSA